MNYDNSVANLPYNLPKQEKDQLEYLANIVNLPKVLIENAGQDEVDAICATILYRHLNRNQKMEAMAIIKRLGNKRLISILIDNVLMTTYINPQWGI